jgi:hypothetical protein
MKRNIARTVLLTLMAAAPIAAHANLTYTVTFDDPLNLAAAYRSQIDAHLGAAVAAWATHLAGSAEVDIEVRMSTSLAYASGHSATSAYVGEAAGGSLWAQGMAYKISSGIDPNGSAPDVILDLNPNYMANTLWFDPNPYARTAAVPNNRTDAESVFIHEIGHALAFNGWGDPLTGRTPNGFGMSTWDQYVSYDGANMFFNGPNAMRVYGAAVPITSGNNFHFGNAPASGRPGADLVNDLFNGWVFYNGQRYSIGALDEAVLADVGLALASPVPEPSTGAMLLLGLAGLAGWRRRAPRGQCPQSYMSL